MDESQKPGGRILTMAGKTVITGTGDSRQEWQVAMEDLTDSGSPTLQETEHGGDWLAYSQEYDSKFPDGSYGHIEVRGPKKSAVLSVHGHVKGGALRKFGFREYTISNGPPKYFLIETASGGFPGCASKNADPKTYSGNQRYEIAQWGPTYRQSFSRDVWNSPYYSYSGGRNWKRWPGEGATDYPLVETPTMREWVETSDCDNKPVEDRIRFELSDELTLARMKQLVEANFSRERYQQRWPGHWNSEGSILFTSPDEGLFIHQKYYYYFTLSIPTGYPFSHDESLSLDFKYRILRVNMTTLRVTESTRTITVVFRNGNSLRFPENQSEFLELTAQDGEMAVIRPAPASDQPRKDFFCHPSPIAYFKNTPRMMGRSRTIPVEPQWTNSDQFEEARSE
jgi:hypothetical protein